MFTLAKCMRDDCGRKVHFHARSVTFKILTGSLFRTTREIFAEFDRPPTFLATIRPEDSENNRRGSSEKRDGHFPEHYMYVYSFYTARHGRSSGEIAFEKTRAAGEGKGKEKRGILGANDTFERGVSRWIECRLSFVVVVVVVDEDSRSFCLL